MPNAFVINKLNTVSGTPSEYGTPSEHCELLAFKVQVDDKSVWLVTPHGNYEQIGKEVRAAIDAEYPDAQEIKVVAEGYYQYAPGVEPGIHIDRVARYVDTPDVSVQGTITVDGKVYRLVPVEDA